MAQNTMVVNIDCGLKWCLLVYTEEPPQVPMFGNQCKHTLTTSNSETDLSDALTVIASLSLLGNNTSPMSLPPKIDEVSSTLSDTEFPGVSKTSLQQAESHSEDRASMTE